MRAAASILACLILGAPAAGEVVERRGGASALMGELRRVDDAGVSVRSSLGAEHFVPWDRVRDVTGGERDAALADRLRTAAELWRARSRVERGDTELAEPILERLFEQYRGATHETALVVAEGLLRCRVARADHLRAIEPALEVGRLLRAGVETGSYATLPPVFDEGYALCTVLAPAWLQSPLLEPILHDLDAYDAQGDAAIAAIAALYRDTIAAALGRPAPADAGALPEHPGVELLRLVRDCAADDEARRRAARNGLERAAAAMPGWAQAWAHYALGASLSGEPRLDDRQAGAVHLVHVPARHAESQPYLAGLALDRAADLLETMADPAGATTLRQDLLTSYPHHPIHGAPSEGTE